MSAGDLAEPIRGREPVRTAPQPRSPWLRLVPSVPVDAPRTPFAVFVIGLLAVGLVGLLLLNTSLQKRAFEVSSLKTSTAALTDQQSELEQRAADLSAPARVAERATELGMVPNGNPVFLRLGDAKVLGKPSPAVKPAPLVTNAEKKAAKLAAVAAKKAAARAKVAAAAAATKSAAAAVAKAGARTGGPQVTTPDEQRRRRRSNAALRPRSEAESTARAREPAKRPAKKPPRAQGKPRPRRDQRPTNPRPRRDQRPTNPRPATSARRPRRSGPLVFKLGSQTRRLRASFLAVAFIMSIFAGRLIQLQGIDANAYATQARDARLRTVVLPATRGDITDTNGVALATTVDTVAITADPKWTALDAAQIAGIIAPRLGLDSKKLIATLSTPNKRFVYVARQVDQSVWKKVRNDLATAGFAGVSSEPDPKRVYPAKSVAASLVGFVGNDTSGLTGRAGLEDSLNSILAGKNGQQTYEASSDGPALPLGDASLQEPVAGQGVQLTIDSDLQYAAQKAVADAVHVTGAASGDAIVLDVKTGAILAMATAPTYDANDGGKVDASLQRDRPVTDVYEPGSVFKLFTASALLDQGLVTPATKELVPGYLYRDGSRIKDWWPHGTARLTFAGSISQSSNIGTILAAEQMSASVQRSYLTKFGFGQTVGIPLPGQSPGQVSSLPWSSLTKSTVSFGQGVSVNALQMAAGVATIANGGQKVTPQLVKGYVAADATITPTPAVAPTRVISDKASKQLIKIMEQVTQAHGLAPNAGIAGYRTAGKTGTAQKANSACGCYRNYTVSFAEIAPADSPRFVAYVDLQNVGGNAGGGRDAGPVAASILKAALQKYHVPPSGTSSPKLAIDW